MCLLSDETLQRTLNIMKDKSIIQIGGYFSWHNNRKRAQVRRRPQQKRRSKRICPVSSFIAIIVSRARKFSGAQFLKTISKIRKTKRKLWSCVDGHHQKKEREIWKFQVAVASSRYRHHKLTCASRVWGNFWRRTDREEWGAILPLAGFASSSWQPPPPQFSYNDGDSWEKAT